MLTSLPGVKDSALESIVHRAAACCGATLLSVAPPDAGSRRRRLWELDAHAHCPVVGVCLPIGPLRRVIDKVLGGEALADDYELHCGVIAECKRRTPIAEAINKELDRRYAAALRRSAACKSADALAASWAQANKAGDDLPGALWATLTHARCDPILEHQVLGQVHMLQHQVGAAQRVDQARLDGALEDANALRLELAQWQQRQQRQASEQARQAERLQEQLMRARADLIGRDTAIGALRDELQALEAAVPGLKSRVELLRQGQRHAERLIDLERALARAQQEAERQRRRADEAVGALAALDASAEAPPADVAALPAPAPTALGDRAVLCVGGRPASVPLYRHIVERTGGRFLHHDGGEEQSVARLDATLAAADLVICQTGCISHDAYWRVKDHCKRTGKPCVFVDNPGSASLKRALADIPPGLTT